MNNEEIIIDALKRIEDKIDAQNGRIRKLEQWRSFIVGGLAVITFVMLIGIPTFLNIVMDGS